jgi:CheY-like chemotaxis protein
MSDTQGDILVVDDQPVNVRLLATMLAQLGYRVRKATSGEMALTAIHAELPDLILLDITMPQMDGYELCEILKKDPKTAEIPVIFVSALDESMDKAKAFEVGAVDYVAKPFQWVEVQARVKTQLALRQLQRQASATNNLAPDDPVVQAILWAQSMPDITAVTLATQPSASHPELFHWQQAAQGKLLLTLARTALSPPTATVLLATLRGLFKGLSLEASLQNRVRYAHSLIASDLEQAKEDLQVFHGELNEENRTLTYSSQGYAIALVRASGVAPQAEARSIVMEKGDRLFIFSADLTLDSPQLTDILTQSVQSWVGATPSAAMLQRMAREIKGAIAHEGSITVLSCFS